MMGDSMGSTRHGVNQFLFSTVSPDFSFGRCGLVAHRLGCLVDQSAEPIESSQEVAERWNEAVCRGEAAASVTGG
jgi:hypothetical protein